jgi:hypothetical protein
MNSLIHKNSYELIRNNTTDDADGQVATDATICGRFAFRAVTKFGELTIYTRTVLRLLIFSFPTSRAVRSLRFDLHRDAAAETDTETLKTRN